MKTDNTCVFLPHVKHKNWQHMCFSSLHQTWTLTTHVFLPHVKHENWQHMCFSSSWKTDNTCVFLPLTNMKTDNKCIFLTRVKHENWQQMCFSSYLFFVYIHFTLLFYATFIKTIFFATNKTKTKTIYISISC